MLWSFYVLLTVLIYDMFSPLPILMLTVCDCRSNISTILWCFLFQTVSDLIFVTVVLQVDFYLRYLKVEEDKRDYGCRVAF